MSIVSDAGILRIIELLQTDITHVGIGNGTPPTAVSTLLGNELERKVNTTVVDGTTLIIEGYWDETEANGITYTEAGCFGDGATITVDTGTLFSGGAITSIKDNTQTLTISIEITVESVNI